MKNTATFFFTVACAAMLLMAAPVYAQTMQGADVTAAAPAPFKFENYKTLDLMRDFIERTYPLGTPRAALRAAFVAQGGGKLYINPARAEIEKYVYDINLCDLYIWRWNISADFDEAGNLAQAYVNGRRVFMAGRAARYAHYESGGGGFAKMTGGTRPMPEATRGPKQIVFMIYDGDGDLKTVADQFATGFGHAAADPTRLQEAANYNDVELWRSIFSLDGADAIAPFAGACNTAKRPSAK
ncbi:MAG: hypothetical protein PW788_10815 [Micavibrio sp.]|nr:hypothetical protein [Micavibrio sp.]